MTITSPMVKNAIYPPELIPDSWFGAVPASAEVAVPILDLKRFTPYLVALTNIQLTANAIVTARIRYDGERTDENTAAMLSVLQGDWWLPAKDLLYYNLLATAAGPVANYTTHYSVWSKLPTIADKLLYGIAVTDEEKAIAERHNVINTVEKGLLPMSIGQQIAREYIVVGRESPTRSVNIALANTPYVIANIYAKPDEFIVLTRLAAAPGTAAQDVRIIVDRDDNANYAEVRTFPLSLVTGGEVNAFIPAMKELRLTTTSTVAPGAHLFRYTYQRVRLTNILRIRFGLVSRDEVPLGFSRKQWEELFDKVRAGIN